MIDTGAHLTETRLDTLEKFAVSTDNRLVNVEKTLSGMTADLRTVVQAVTTVQSRPQWDVGKILDYAAKAIVIFIAVTGGVTYIAGNLNAPAVARQEERLQFLQLRMDRGWFQPSDMKIRAPGGTVSQ